MLVCDEQVWLKSTHFGVSVVLNRYSRTGVKEDADRAFKMFEAVSERKRVHSIIGNSRPECFPDLLTTCYV